VRPFWCPRFGSGFKTRNPDPMNPLASLGLGLVCGPSVVLTIPVFRFAGADLCGRDFPLLLVLPAHPRSIFTSLAVLLHFWSVDSFQKYFPAPQGRTTDFSKGVTKGYWHSLSIQFGL